MILPGATTPYQSGLGSSSINGTSPSNCLKLYPRHFLTEDLTPLQRCSRYILQPQTTRMVTSSNFFSTNNLRLFGITYSRQIWIILKQVYLTSIWVPSRYYHSGSEWTCKQWQWKGDLYSLKLKHYCSLPIRLFNIQDTCWLAGFLPLCRDVVGIFYRNRVTEELKEGEKYLVN